MSTPQVIIVGSINMDLVIRCDRLPQPGETILAHSVDEVCGGKGANQAVAVARAGGQATMIGRIGDDSFASRLRQNLEDEGIDVTRVMSTPHTASGLATVNVESSGQNMILVVPGANGLLSVDDIGAAADAIANCDVLLLQLEVPMETVLAAKRIAKQSNVRVIVDPAPAPVELPEELIDADLLCPNESEAAALTGMPVGNAAEAESAARQLVSRGACAVAITRGSEGVLLYDGRQSHCLPPHPIEAVDTTAAGDAFAGALAVRWAASDDLLQAVRFANAAGAIAASRHGAQPGMGYAREIDALQQ